MRPPALRHATALCAAALLAPAVAGAEGWAGFYTPIAPEQPLRPAVTLAPPARTPARGQRPVNASDACISAILDAQARYNIPDNLLLAIGLQEAGLRRNGHYTVWPWSVNAAGDGRMFGTEADAMKWVQNQQSVGITSIDVGCMQVNLRWHPDAFASLAEAFDPVANVDYAARFLLDLRQRTGNWMTAAGSYHSQSGPERSKYLASLQQNLAVANTRIATSAPLSALAPTAVAAPAPRPGSLPAPTLALAPAPAPEEQPNIAWSASLSAAKNGRRLSIYSTQDLQPILPKFTQDF
ncbi:lytic transglycosylase domain-containing protein [Solirhodobacter olei]|uniref:lytic transglycosylase domain-containing protein n=1 Tax=Solirhodobacter olei TaxID=2493082 RepID=UPI000FD6BFC3|nr:lytic transglycosylase domain-containing protein [Solirhodobacter olei]